MSKPPSGTKNFIPLRSLGRWLAVSITAPSKAVSGKTVLINIAGVEARPQSKAAAPQAVMPPMAAAVRLLAVRRLSWPTPTRRSAGALPVFALSPKAKAAAGLRR